jgi:hypothetical protein
MKKLMTVLLALTIGLMLTTTSFAKDNAYAAGNMFLSGDTNLNMAFGTDSLKLKDQDKQDTDHVVFGLGTRAGYFFINGLEAGLGMTYDYDKSSYKEDYTSDSGDDTSKINVDDTTSSYLIGLQGQYFFDMNGIDPFIGVLIGYNGLSNENKPEKGDKTTSSGGGLAYDISAGVNFLLNKRVGIAPALFYRGASVSGTNKYGSESIDFDSTSSRYGLRIGIDLFL